MSTAIQNPKGFDVEDFFWTCDSATYHRDFNYVSHSALEEFRDSIPAYYGMYVTQELERGEPTDALALGTALHGLLLEPELIEARLIVLPAGDGRTKAVKEERERLTEIAKRAGLMTIRQDLWDDARNMADSARRHPQVKEMIELKGWCEQAVRVEHPELGKLKARYDKIFECGHILDLKTTRRSRPEIFERDVYTLGYHRQASHYETVRDIAFGEGEGLFLYVAINSEEPFETIVYDFAREAIDLGRVENTLLLAELNDRRERNDWSSRWKGIQRLSLPEWAYRRTPTV